MLLVHFVAKKDGKRRMVQDSRHINKRTIKDGYPLPLIADILDSVGTKKVFTKLKLYWGYNNMRIKEGNKWKVAFTMHIGSYEPTVMYFRLTNSPATFQTIINNLFCHKPLLSPSILLLFFSFSFTFCSIYSVGKSIMLYDIRRDRVTSHVTSQDMSHIVWLGVWDN